MNVKNSSPARDRFNLLLKNSERLDGRFLVGVARSAAAQQADQAACADAGSFGETAEGWNSPWMVESLNADPYWPKWNSPWWHLTLQMEMADSPTPPAELLEHFAARINDHYLKVFPIKEEEMPPGKDPMRDILCFCAMGTAVQILEGRGLNSDQRIPWVRSWFERYQMADGGYNCDEAAYLKDHPCSSIVSTVPMLEALVALSERGLTPRESEILEKGITYLLKRCLFKSISKNAPMDQNFTELTFPRFYEYDILRGLSLVCNWAVRFEKTLPFGAIEEALHLCCSKIGEDAQLRVERQFYSPWKTVKCIDGQWTRGHEVSVFPLLTQVGALKTTSVYLTARLAEVLNNLHTLDERGQIEF